MRIPDHVIEEVRQRANIVDVISDYLTLTPSGRNYKALSPFTREKTPSFIVSPEKQIYKCFSSGKGGNAFTFVMEMENIGFIDALKLIAKKVGVDLSQYEKQSKTTQKSQEEREEYSLLTWGAKLFHEQLQTSEGKLCLDYLEKRGVLKETISKFGLGFSMNSWENLYDKALNENHDTEKLKTLGLLSYNEKHQKYYDTFRGRLMFPIFSTAGKVVGFGGRIITDLKNSPKYINSPESNVYEKSKLLYAMNFAGQEVRRKQNCILVEGYMDAIALHQEGITNAVATSGTALTPQQAQLIKRYTNLVTFIYDGDKAGINAMMRGVDVLLEEGLHVAICVLPESEDPDSFIKAVGKDEFQHYISDHQQSFLDFKLGILKSNHGFETAESTATSIRDLVNTLTKISDELEVESHIKWLSEKTDFSYGLLKKEFLKAAKPKQGWSKTSAHHRSQDHRYPKSQTTPLKPSSQEEKPTVLESTFIKALLESTYHGYQILHFVDDHQTLFSPNHPWIRKTMDFLLSRYHELKSSDRLTKKPPIIAREIDRIDDQPLRSYLSSLLMSDPISERWPTETPQDYAQRCLKEFIDAAIKMNLEHFSVQKSQLINELNQGLEPEKEMRVMKNLHDLQINENKAKKHLQEELRIFNGNDLLQ